MSSTPALSSLPVWWNGQLLSAEEALAPALSTGSLWGRGLFETIAVSHGRPLALTRHLDRLRRSAAALALLLPDDPTLHAAIASVLAPCPPSPHRLRLTLTGGPTTGLSLTPDSGNLLIHLTPVFHAAPSAILLTSPWRRNEHSPLSGLKSTSYAENALALAWAQEHGATEALLLNTAGHLCEGATSNLFLVHGGTLLTPPLSSGCLPGVTRSLILDLCPQLGLTCVEKPLAQADLTSAEEIFLTNSLRGILPVARADKLPFQAPGPLTAQLTTALTDLLARFPDP